MLNHTTYRKLSKSSSMMVGFITKMVETTKKVLIPSVTNELMAN